MTDNKKLVMTPELIDKWLHIGCPTEFAYQHARAYLLSREKEIERLKEQLKEEVHAV